MRFCTVQASDNCVESGVEDLREAGARARDLPSRTRSGRRAPILAGLRSNEGTGCPALWLPDLKNATQLPGASSLCDIQRAICQGKTKLCLLFCVALKLVGHHSGLKGHSGLASPALLFQIESFHLKGWLPLCLLSGDCLPMATVPVGTKACKPKLPFSSPSVLAQSVFTCLLLTAQPRLLFTGAVSCLLVGPNAV